MQNSDLGIDLGTASVLVYVKNKGVVLKEPSVVAFDKDTNKIRAIGEEARLMIGRTPGTIQAIRPLRHGVISDYTEHRRRGAPESAGVAGTRINERNRPWAKRCVARSAGMKSTGRIRCVRDAGRH